MIGTARGHQVRSSYGGPGTTGTGVSTDVYAISTVVGMNRLAEHLFPKTSRITLPTERDLAPTLDLWTARPDRFSTLYDDATETAVYVWGRATHPRLTDDALLLACIDWSARGSENAFRE